MAFPLSVPFLEVTALFLGVISVGIIGAVYVLFKPKAKASA